ncbi:RDD family protein [Microbacterium hominis]|uniref:RDD family protein n=1 Tax=Microbacterium hominis TaxID=162426 RepID=A0A7D4THD3_9MICO|nr:RDD family protein [Microbacterium hominis]QKJ20001.1 RDD family protein [Microbacterium hominis]
MPDGPAPAPRAVDIHQDEVLTGEAVALDVQPVGFFLRALGTLLDMLLGVAVFVLFGLLATWLLGESLLDGAVLPILTIAVVVIVTIVVPTAVETASRGRSLGRLAVGGRIVRTDGGAAGFRHAFIRALVGVFELWLTFGAVAALVGAFTPRAQRLGDLLAGTYSERTRTPRLPAPPGGVPSELVAWAATADVARLPDRLARRISRFGASAANLDPVARRRLALALAEETAAHVSPVPEVDAETFLLGVAAVRRDRELRALALEAARVDALTATAAAGTRGFPRR